jgi:hypothetical protein
VEPEPPPEEPGRVGALGTLGAFGSEGSWGRDGAFGSEGGLSAEEAVGTESEWTLALLTSAAAIVAAAATAMSETNLPNGQTSMFFPSDQTGALYTGFYSFPRTGEFYATHRGWSAVCMA